MNAVLQAQNAYSPLQAPTLSKRATEAQLFSKITSQLRIASQTVDQNYGGFVTALYNNQEMWSTLALDLIDDRNNLPQELRAQLLSLSIFTEKHTERALNNTADISALIEINTAVLRGLTENGAK